jgi:hypothetical protein
MVRRSTHVFRLSSRRRRSVGLSNAVLLVGDEVDREALNTVFVGEEEGVLSGDPVRRGRLATRRGKISENDENAPGSAQLLRLLMLHARLSRVSVLSPRADRNPLHLNTLLFSSRGRESGAEKGGGGDGVGVEALDDVAV